MVSAGPVPPLKSNAGFNEHTLSVLGAKRKPWDTICLCLSVLAAFIFFPLPHSKGSYLELLFVTPLQTQGEGWRGVRYQESGTKADKRAGRYSEIPGW